MLSIVMMILSFFLAKKKGASTGAALGIAAGVGAATWLTVDPMNSSSLWGAKVGKYLPSFFSKGSATTTAAAGVGTVGAGVAANGITNEDGSVTGKPSKPYDAADGGREYANGAASGADSQPGIGSRIVDGLSGVASTGITSIADVAKTWGPVGTTGAVLATKNSSRVVDFLEKNWKLIGAGVLAYMILK